MKSLLSSHPSALPRPFPWCFDLCLVLLVLSLTLTQVSVIFVGLMSVFNLPSLPGTLQFEVKKVPLSEKDRKWRVFCFFCPGSFTPFYISFQNLLLSHRSLHCAGLPDCVF